MIIQNEGSPLFVGDISYTWATGTTEINNALLYKMRSSADTVTALIDGTLLLYDDAYHIDTVSDMMSYLFNVVSLVNTTNNPISVDDIGITIDTNSFYRYADILKLRASNMLLLSLRQGDIVIDNGLKTLSLIESLQLIHGINATYMSNAIGDDQTQRFPLLMSYDVLRNKSLSVDSHILSLVTDQLQNGEWLRWAANVGSSDIGWTAPMAGTVVGYTFNSVTNSGTSVDLYINNSATNLFSTTDNSMHSYSLNIDFERGQKIRLYAGAGDATGIVLSLIIKWRNLNL